MTSLGSGSRAAALAALLFVLAPARALPAEQGVSDPGAVRSVIASIIAANYAGDLEAVSRLYSDDAILIPPGEDPVRGRASLLERYRKGFAEDTIELAFTSEETEVAGEWAFDRGRTHGKATPKSGGEPRQIDDKYVMLLRRGEDGSWRISRLIWNRMDPAR